MRAACYALLALVGSTPILLFLDARWLDAVIEIYSATTLAMVALSLRRGEAGHWIKTIRLPLALAAVPALWMLIQLLPIPIGSVSKSIWQSAAAALGVSLLPSITIDPGLTLMAFCRYASLIAVTAAAAAIAIDRQNAEKLLIALGCAASAIALVWLARIVVSDRAASQPNGLDAAAVTGSIYGIVLFSAMVILFVDRQLDRTSRRDASPPFVGVMVGIAVGFIICSMPSLMIRSHAIFAAGCGLVPLLIVQFVRRIGFDWRAGATMGAIAFVGAAVIISTSAVPSSKELATRYASQASADQISIVDRVINEVGATGSGAGTFAAIYKLYAPQDPNDKQAFEALISTPATVPPTAASQISVELGQPALWTIVLLILMIVLRCAHGSFIRGRDSFYPVAGAGVGIATLVLMFCDGGLANLATSVLLAATIGLALAQSMSRKL
jgi:hypothetical protein